MVSDSHQLERETAFVEKKKQISANFSLLVSLLLVCPELHEETKGARIRKRRRGNLYFFSGTIECFPVFFLENEISKLLGFEKTQNRRR